jgi:hypothetical protein
MNPESIKKIITSEWSSKEFDAVELCIFLEVSMDQAEAIIRSINGPVEVPTILHHELREYLKDTQTVRIIVTKKMPPSGEWLLEECGWQYDDSRELYCYYHTSLPNIRMTLRNALKYQSVKEWKRNESLSTVIDVEFEKK